MTYAAASAIGLLLTTSVAFAESHTNAESMAGEMGMASTEELGAMEGQLIRSRDITGGAVYTMNQADDEGWDPELMYDEVNANWNQIGEIEDIVLNHDGQVVGIVAEVGGFLDLGDKHVMIEVNNLNLVAVDDVRYAYVTRYSEEQLEELEGVDEAFWN